LPYSTSEVVWGEPGTNGQHAFFQMLHQGTDVIPVDFILIKRPTYAPEPVLSGALKSLFDQQHATLLANGVAQAQALMWGKGTDEAEQEPRPPTASATMPARDLALQRTFPGNRPSLTLVLDELTPTSMGALVALYEHRTFVAGALWGINSFDQWGVELGKVLCKDVAARMQSGDLAGVDSATAAMIARLR
jgi:glucose-6-phosphate isomerase